MKHSPVLSTDLVFAQEIMFNIQTGNGMRYQQNVNTSSNIHTSQNTRDHNVSHSFLISC